MSAILSADDLNDFISPGIACIKPVETLPKQQPPDSTSSPYEVTTEDKLGPSAPQVAAPAQISLTDCLACAGCVTSAEAVLVSLQSHGEVLDTLDKYRSLDLPWLHQSSVANGTSSFAEDAGGGGYGKIFVASVSPQSKASIAATYNVSSREAGNMIAQLLSGPHGLRGGGEHGSAFTWIIDTNVMREACLVSAAEEVQHTLQHTPMTPEGEEQKKPILTSACPGWICYAEKTHPHILPHLSKMKSPQALTGTLIKSVLAKKFGIPPEKVWHLAVMPCFDKKLEASRSELTSFTWDGTKSEAGSEGEAVRDVDCVITARELLMLAESRDISFPRLPRTPLPEAYAPPFPDIKLDTFLFGHQRHHNPLKRKRHSDTDLDPSQIGTSGGYLHHVLKTQQSLYPHSSIKTSRGRNNDVCDYTLISPEDGRTLFKAARYYGFRNIQNLVRRLKPVSASKMPGAAAARGRARKPGAATAGKEATDYSYIEVMACPGGCTNGGGQIKVGDVATLRQAGIVDVGGVTGVKNGSLEQEVLPQQREWLGVVDEAYWSASASDDDEEEAVSGDQDGDGDIIMNGTGISRHVNVNGGVDGEFVNGTNVSYIKDMLRYWAEITDVQLENLIHTTYRVVESDVGKDRAGGGGSDMERVSALAVAQGGGW